MTLYQTNFGPVDDGSTDTREAHDAWSEVQDQVRDGWLVEVRLDHEAAAKCLWYQERYTDFRNHPSEQDEYRRRARLIVDAALGAGIGDTDE